MSPHSWKALGSYLYYNSYKIFTIDVGVGDTIVLIHGFPTSSWDWHKLFKKLSQNYRIVAMDLLGFGFSDKPLSYKYSIRDQANLIESILLQKNISNFHILSHDYGDTVAQELLARNLEDWSNSGNKFEIESTCFLNGGLFPQAHRPLLIQKILMGPLGRFVGKFFTKSKLEKNFRKIFGPNTQPTKEEIDQYWSIITYNKGLRISHLLIRYIRERIANEQRWIEAIQKSEIPIQLINGLKDSISGANMVEAYKNLITNPNIIELPTVGHYPNMEAPEKVTQHFLSFLQNYSST